MSPPLPDAICAKCIGPATMMCSRCMETYCCSDCQILDWKEHKTVCLELPDLIPIRKTQQPRSGVVELVQRHQMRCPPPSSSGVGSAPGYFSAQRRTNSNNSNNNSGAGYSESQRRTNNNSSGSGYFDSQRRTNNNNNSTGGGGGNIPKPPDRPPLEDKDFRLKPKVVEKPAAWTTHFLPPKTDFFEVFVQFVEELDPSIVWVSEFKYAAAMRKLFSEIQCSIGKALASSPIKNLRVGALVAAPLNEEFYRAEVLELTADSPQHAATVRLIDYGNEMCLPISKLHPPIPIMVNLNAYAFRIRLPQNFCGSLELESLLTVRLLGATKTPDGLYRVEVKPKSVPLTLPVAELAANHAVVPLKVFPGGRHALLRLSCAENPPPAAGKDLNAFLNTEQGLKFEFDTAAAALLAEGAFVAARTLEQGWRRACLLEYAGGAQHCYLVYLIDDGRMCLCNQVKRIPEAFAMRPMRVFVVSTAAAVAAASEESLLDTQLAGFIGAGKPPLSLQLNPLAADSKQPSALPCALYAADNTKKLADVLAACFTGLLKDLPSIQYWSDPIDDGSSVFITRVFSHADVFIAATSCKQYTNLFAALASYCGVYAPQNPLLATGDIVLVNVAGTAAFFRGEIKSCRISAPGAAPTFKVVNIDTGAICDDIPLHLLRKPSSFVRCCPVSLQRVKLIYMESIPNPEPDNQALAFLLHCQANAVEFNVKFDALKADVVDLLFPNKEQPSLSVKLLPLLFEKCADAVAEFTSPTPSIVCDANLAERTPLPPSPPDSPVVRKAPVMFEALAPSPPPSPTSLSKGTPQHLAMPNLNIEEILQKHLGRVYTMDDLEIVPISVGDNVPVFILDTSTINAGYITASYFGNESLLSEMERNLATISKYCKCPHVIKGYAPRVHEICLAVYSGDGEWYRALCLEHLKKEKEDEVDSFCVRFIDYGNICKVSKDEILPITKDLLFPLNANRCYIEGLTTKEQCAAFAAAANATSDLNCKVTRQEDGTYLIKVQDFKKHIA